MATNQQVKISLTGDAENYKKAVSDAQKVTQDFYNSGIMSAKHYAAAVRMVPAQITDIVTSLAGGQNPLLVMIQQGGQLKDMFGGSIPMALRATGSAVMAMINPWTAAAAAIGGAGYAAYAGRKEWEGLQSAMINSGNYAGTTASQVEGAAQRIAQSTGASQSAAREALQATLATGQIGGMEMERIAQIAAKAQKVAGVAVSETVQQFVALSKDPVKASVELNEKTNYLTESVYRQIKALQDQGKTVEASKLAISAFADESETRLSAVAERVGYIEAAWDATVGAIVRAKNAMANWGIPNSVVDEIEALRTKIRDKENVRDVMPGFVAGVMNPAIDGLKLRQRLLEDGLKYEAQSAAYQAQNAQATKDAAGWQSQFVDRYLPKSVQMAREIAAATAAWSKSGKRDAKELETVIEGIRAKNKGGKPSEIVDTTAQKLIDRLRMEGEKLKGTLTEVDAIQTQINEANQRKPGTFSLEQANEALRLARENEMTKARQEADKRAEQSLLAITAAREKENESFGATLANLNAEANAREFEASLIGKTADEVQRLRTARELEQSAAKAIGSIENPTVKQIKAVDYMIERQREAVARIQADAKDRRENPMRGISDGLREYEESLKNAGDRTRQYIKGGFDSLETSIKDTVKSGKLELGSLRDAIMNTWLDMAIKSIMRDAFGASSSMFGMLFGGKSFEGGGYTGNGPRSGGLDGRGGYLAMVHPQEDVIDRTRAGNSYASNQTVVINQSMTIGDVADMARVRGEISVNNQRLMGALARQRRYGGVMA